MPFHLQPGLQIEGRFAAPVTWPEQRRRLWTLHAARSRFRTLHLLPDMLSQPPTAGTSTHAARVRRPELDPFLRQRVESARPPQTGGGWATLSRSSPPSHHAFYVWLSGAAQQAGSWAGR